MLPSPIDFLNIFVHYPHALLEFLEKYTSKVKDSSAQVEIHNTLLELYLSHDLDFPSISQSNIDDGGNDLAHRPSKEVSNGKAISDKKDVNDEKGHQERRRKGLTLLKSAWPSELEQPLYDVDLAIILCEMNDFKEGLLFLYEKMKLYKEVIACYMQVHDHEDTGQKPCLSLSVIKDYIARKLEHESQLIEEDRRAMEKYQRCLGDNEKECPECAPEYRTVLETKRSLEQSSKNPDQFFQLV
ncbi:hypothetical protein K7X08_004261 [Anisodus acutangulus]|uniref:Uncharacterized protein n=1 Tax=Anisodus acutangulus TaxID=402998 RepID=A0A9Q1RH99_9SOLA|nr:hypothetical protein K7X08_004261 [Anisodus acutangulus]